MDEQTIKNAVLEALIKLDGCCLDDEEEVEKVANQVTEAVLKALKETK